MRTIAASGGGATIALMAVGRSHPGKVRPQNEDSYLIRPVPHGVLVAVADGIGGGPGGLDASTLALRTLDQALTAAITDVGRLADAVAQANRLVFQQGQKRKDLEGMGTTLTAGVVLGDRLFLAHVGDSRAYRVTPHGLEQLTDDHSMAAEMERFGTLSAKEVERHPQRHVLTRAIGPYNEVRIDVQDRAWGQGERLLLCSDGLSNVLADAQIWEIVEHLHGQAVVDRLIQAALEGGGVDNVTVVLVEVEPRVGS